LIIFQGGVVVYQIWQEPIETDEIGDWLGLIENR